MPVFLTLLFIGMASTIWANTAPPFPGDSTIMATICANEAYPFEGQLLNTPGTYSETYTASDGSDSIITHILDVLPLSEGTVTASICQIEFYEFNGLPYSNACIYSKNLTGANGCDSLDILKLTVFPTILLDIF